MNATQALVLCACTTALLAACSSTPKTTPAAAPTAAATSAPSTSAAPTPTAASKVATVTLPDYLDPKNALSTQRSVYFDFDDYSIKQDYVPVIERHGKFLSSHGSVAIKIEGNADERGSAEYNLALGQKRAQAVLGALKVYGVKDSQMEAISWGKERPKAAGHDETSWAQNRRADLAYPSK